jgi:alpha-tubulin suppressor-like RCC1 family protein
LHFPTEEEPVEKIIAGGYHTMILTKSGDLYSFGYNHHGTVGNGTTQNSRELHLVLKNVKEVAAGGIHVLAMDKEGGMWAWGDHRNGQCGFGPSPRTERTESPTKLDFFERHGVTLEGFGCGNYHSFAISSTGDLYTFGFGNRCGVSEEDIKSPHKLEVNVLLPQLYTGRQWASVFRWLFLGNAKFNELSEFSVFPVEVLFHFVLVLFKR